MKTINLYYEDTKDLNDFVLKHYDILFINKPTVLIQVFSGSCEREFLIKLMREINERVPHAQVMGTTTSGEIMNGTVSALKTVISVSIFHHTKIRSAFVSKTDLTDYQLGQSLVSTLCSEEAKILILFATGLTINANHLLKGVQSICSTIPIAGGNAGDNSLIKQSFVFCNTEISDCGVVGAVLESRNLSVHNHWHLGWQPIGKEMTITKADELRVYTIDDIPAYKAYQKYLGLDEVGNFLNAVEYPLIAERHGVQTARMPNVRYEDDSLGFLADIIEGEKVRFSFGHVATILDKIDNLCHEIRKQSVESIFVYTCTSRRGFLQELSEIETTPLQEIAPTAGFFTYGEFFHAEDTNQLLNATMTVLALSEAENVISLEAGKGLKSQKPKFKPEFDKDNVAARNLGVLKTLTHLVNTVTAELTDANEKLQYISHHDALTGVYNRVYFEQEMKYFDSLTHSIGIIICDVDCLKLVNDILGHDFGDKILRMAANKLQESCRPNDIIARIGGDEFAIIVPDAELPILEGICNRIIGTSQHTQHSALEEVLHLSVGFAIKSAHGAGSMAEAFKLADFNMYGRKSVESVSVQKAIINSFTRIKLEEEQAIHSL